MLGDTYLRSAVGQVKSTDLSTWPRQVLREHSQLHALLLPSPEPLEGRKFFTSRGLAGILSLSTWEMSWTNTTNKINQLKMSDEQGQATCHPDADLLVEAW